MSHTPVVKEKNCSQLFVGLSTQQYKHENKNHNTQKKREKHVVEAKEEAILNIQSTRGGIRKVGAQNTAQIHVGVLWICGVIVCR